MKSITRFLALIALTVVLASTGWAQATLRSTTLSAAIADINTTTITVASATGIEVNDIAFVDREAMSVKAISGTTLTVKRGVEGTVAATHANAATIYIDDRTYFSNYDRSGSCTSTNETVLPVINVSSGTYWDCVSSVWTIVGGPKTSYTGITTLTPTSAGGASVGSAALPWANLWVGAAATNNFKITGTATAARVMTLPDTASDTFAFIAATQTFTNKTLTSPKIGTSILDTNGLELFKLTATGSAVNEITVANAATAGAPTVSATGDDANISIKLAGKGTGGVLNTSGLFWPTVTVTTDSTAGNITLTAAQILGGLILRDPNGGARTDTLPTAALLVAAMPNAIVGSSFEFTIRNTADAAETITVASGAGGTDSGTMTIAQNNTKRFLIVLTNVGGGTEAYTTYSLGTVVH